MKIFKEGDFVMANIINEFGQDCWVPGIVQFVNYDSEPISYRVLYYNGEEGSNTYTQLIKLSKDQYFNIKDYILLLISKK